MPTHLIVVIIPYPSNSLPLFLSQSSQRHRVFNLSRPVMIISVLTPTTMKIPFFSKLCAFASLRETSLVLSGGQFQVSNPFTLRSLCALRDTISCSQGFRSSPCPVPSDIRELRFFARLNPFPMGDQVPEHDFQFPFHLMRWLVPEIEEVLVVRIIIMFFLLYPRIFKGQNFNI